MIPIFEVSDADIAFPTAQHIPKKEDIPKEFWKTNGTIWHEAFNDWFFTGIRAEQFTSKEGVDKGKAIRALKSIMGSWGPKHEHKVAACTYLMSEWFSDYKKKDE